MSLAFLFFLAFLLRGLPSFGPIARLRDSSGSSESMRTVPSATMNVSVHAIQVR